MTNCPVTGSYTLPSLGKVYGDKQINPEVTLRSMTTAEEMKRLNPSDRAYKVLADIIDDCLIEKLPISSYDMCLGDYQYLMHKLRIVTYGSTYALSTTCPYCGCVNKGKINLTEMEVFKYDDSLLKYFELDLPITGHHITLKMQTPRMLDDIAVESKELRKKYPNMTGDTAFFLTIEYLIDLVDGKKPDPVLKPDFVRNLPMMDTNTILAYSQKLNERIGLNTVLDNKCDYCGLEYQSSFRTTGEFFRPTINI